VPKSLQTLWLLMDARYRPRWEGVGIKKAAVEGSTTALQERRCLAGAIILLRDFNSRTQLSVTLFTIPLYRSVPIDSNFIQEFTLTAPSVIMGDSL